MNDQASPHLALEQKRLALLRRQRGECSRNEPGQGAIPARQAEGPVRASFAQQRLWFLDRLAPGNPFYTVSLDLPLSGPIDPDLLEQALLEIARRHEALRTTFAEQDGQPMQIVHPEPAFPMERIDLAPMSRAEAERALARLAAEEAARSFDLQRGPLAVARLVTLGPDRFRLLLTLHHIVCDGWSLKVLGRELGMIYGALAAGKPHGLPDLAVQYRDFSAWQHEVLAGSRMAAHRDYWARQLAGAPELAIHTDFRRPAIPTYGGAFVSLALDRTCAQRVRAFCAEAGCTPFMVLLAAWMVLLGRHADMDDILVAAPSAGRGRRELEPMIGFFVNTLVLRGDLSGDPSFRETAERVRATCLEAFAHDEMPFDRLIEDIAPERRGDRNPLAQVVFQLFSAPDRTPGSASAPEERQRGTSKFDLRLDLWDTEDGYAGELEYSTDLFEHATAALMAEQFQVLLHELLADPDRPISEAGMMSQREYDWLLANCNLTDRRWPSGSNIPHRFGEIVAQHGERPAVAWGGQHLTYAELDRAADGAASRLAAAGVGRGDNVATLLPRSPALIAAWLGILKLGAAYVPLDLDTPPARVRALLETVKAAAIVTDAERSPLFTEDTPRVIEADLARWREGGDHASAPAGPDDVANIMFTSGSTGRPKAVLVPHRGILRLAVGQDFWPVRPGERIAQGSNCAFDAATLEVWTALLNGCCLVGLEREDLLSPDRLGQRILARDIDHLFITTALFHRLAEDAPGMFAPLRTLITGGSRLDPERVRRVLHGSPPQRLINAYGPTEVTVLATVWSIDALDERVASVPIGSPVANTTAYVLDRLGRLIPRAVPGELFVGGPGVALGYIGEPRQTARKFGPSPFREGEQLYATGDRVRLRHDGVLEFLGRFDDQVKIRGFRVEPDEIAATLRSHPQVAEAQVLVTAAPVADGPAESRLVAFYVPAAEGASAGEGSEDETVAYWRRIYEDVVYRDVGTQASVDAQFEIAGWTDSATGELLPEDEMAEQVRQTCDRILALGGGDILEFGCGTGLIIFPLAPKVKSILGIDISARALDHVRSTAKAAGLDNITLRQGSSEALEEIPDASFDTVVLNSTVQYFPSADYLEALIGELVRVTRPGGAIVLGDIRHLGLLEAFQAEIALDRADIATPAAAVHRAVARKVEEEQELLVHPHWFLALRARLPAIGDISIELKRGKGHNELARFRYDVVLHLGKVSASPSLEEVVWQPGPTVLDDLIDRASAVDASALHVRCIPNARVAQALAAARLLATAGPEQAASHVDSASRQMAEGAISPEQVWQACERRGLACRIGWSDDPGRFDAVLSRKTDLPPLALAGAPPDPGAPLTNAPAQGRQLRRLEAGLVEYLEALLPDYMQPQGFVRLPRLPLTPNGKVDRAALATMLPSTASGRSRAPRTELEKRLAAIFSAVLQVPQVGADDDFFRLGGHSLKATQVISRISAELGVAVPLRAVFERGTVAGLAEAVEVARKNGQGGRNPAPITAANDFDIDAMDGDALERALSMLDEEAAEGLA